MTTELENFDGVVLSSTTLRVDDNYFQLKNITGMEIADKPPVYEKKWNYEKLEKDRPLWPLDKRDYYQSLNKKIPYGLLKLDGWLKSIAITVGISTLLTGILSKNPFVLGSVVVCGLIGALGFKFSSILKQFDIEYQNYFVEKRNIYQAFESSTEKYCTLTEIEPTKTVLVIYLKNEYIQEYEIFSSKENLELLKAAIDKRIMSGL